MFAWIRRSFRSIGRIGGVWCNLMHHAPRWPIHGHYECGICGRRYGVPLAYSRSAILPVLVLAAVVTLPVRGAERAAADDSAAAAAVLERFTAGQPAGGPWRVETIEIEASLPKLKKTGNLTAIRTLTPVGEPDYKVLESGGDPTVKRQVISRYLSADLRANELPASSAAVTPVNYKIHYIGSVSRGDRLAYAFRLIPRRKSENLINGVLWLDRETGIAVRESGRLAKSPSVLVKRINVTRENDLDRGAVQTRITHVAVEMRLVGRAELVIHERPYSGGLAEGAFVGEGQ